MIFIGGFVLGVLVTLSYAMLLAKREKSKAIDDAPITIKVPFGTRLDRATIEAAVTRAIGDSLAVQQEWRP